MSQQFPFVVKQSLPSYTALHSRPCFVQRANADAFNYLEDHAEHKGVIHSGYSDHTAQRTASVSQPQKVTSYLGNTTSAPPHSLDKQNTSDPLGPCIIHSSSNKASSACGFIESATPQYPNTNAIFDEASFVMSGTPIPTSHTKLHSYGPLALHPPGIAPKTPSSPFPREDSSSSLASLEARDSSIRIVKPNLTLSPLNRPKDKDNKKGVTDHSTPSRGGKSQSTTMHQNEQNGQKGPNKVGGSQSRSKAAGEYSSSHSRSQSQNKQSFDTPEGRDPSRASQSDAPTRNGNVQTDSPDRGRTMQRRYEFIDSDDRTHATLSPVQETAKNNNDLDSKSIGHVGRESNMTTMTNLLQQCVESSPPKLPVYQTRRQHQGKGGIGSSSTQPSVLQLKAKHRPPPLNLMNPAYIGMVHRHTNRYQVEHNEIKSSEVEHFNIRSPSASSSVYDGVEDTPRIGPLNIPMRGEINGTNSLQSYREWRENLNLVRTASQGSICIAIPTREEDTFMIRRMMDENRLPIRDYPSVRHPPIISHVRSRSTLGIRENRDKEDRRRHFSGDSVYSDSDYSAATPFNQGSSIGRSATMNEVPRRDRRFSRGSESKTGQNGATANATVARMEVAIPVSPFSPLTPFIMRATGAPAGTEKGSKTLFGEHGWLEDTATSGAKKPKMEKTVGFMESLKRKAREIADSTSFKPIRNIRTSAVSHVSISLDAREQSLLYCELEYNLNNALDAYFKAQLNSGRLEASKLSRVADTWAQKGRPKVIGFRYDLETQVDLIMAHVNDFRFYGPVQAEGPVAIAGLLHAMKTNARYMRIRTFCQPDSVIAKHVLDSQSFLRLLGSPESLQRPLEEVAQFFKVAVERRKAMTEAPAGRIVSNSSGRVISNGSGQHVRFQDDSERHRPCAEMPDAKWGLDGPDSAYFALFHDNHIKAGSLSGPKGLWYL
ncbi:hypothetical protein ANO14919_041680 [Xylariales sp. No.14919]|nr:hypothetical protein ANO14919_041680 [Xylariales sp. No.14919]